MCALTMCKYYDPNLLWINRAGGQSVVQLWAKELASLWLAKTYKRLEYKPLSTIIYAIDQCGTTNEQLVGLRAFRSSPSKMIFTFCFKKSYIRSHSPQSNVLTQIFSTFDLWFLHILQLKSRHCL